MANENINVDNLQPLGESTSELPVAPSATEFEIEVDPGKREKFTAEQIRQFYKGNLRQEDYTRKTQELAEQRKQFEQYTPYIQQLVSEREQIAAFLKNKELLKKYVQENFPDEPVPNQDELARPVDLRTLAEREKQREQTLQQQITHLQTQLQYAQQQGQQHLEQRIKDEIETAQYSEKINTHLSGIYAENPALQLIDNIDDILRYKVFMAKPKDFQETVSLFDKFAKEQVEKLQKHFSTSPTQSPKAVEQAAKPKSIEPPGKGSPPPPPKKNFRNKEGKIDWDAIGEDALAEFRAITKDK